MPRPPGATVFPYTTLFRSGGEVFEGAVDDPEVVQQAPELVGHLGADEVGALGQVLVVLLDVVDQLGDRLPEQIGRATSELQSPCNLVCRLLLEKKKRKRRL